MQEQNQEAELRSELERLVAEALVIADRLKLHDVAIGLDRAQTYLDGTALSMRGGQTLPPEEEQRPEQLPAVGAALENLSYDALRKTDRQSGAR